MGCRPSKQATSKVRAAEEESLDPRCLGSPCHKHRSHGVTRSGGQRVQHSYSEGCHRARAPSNTDADFPAFSTTSAVYRYSASRTSKITLRLSCDGSTLEIEHCDYDLERSRKEREADDVTPRLWGSAPDLGKSGQRPGQQTGLCSPPGLMVCGQAPVWPLRHELPSPGHGDKSEEMKARGGCCQQTVCAVVYDTKGRPVSASVHQLGEDAKLSRPISKSVKSEIISRPNDKHPVWDTASENSTRTTKNTHGSENNTNCSASKYKISSNHAESTDVTKLGDAESGNQETNETRTVGASSESTFQKRLYFERHNNFNPAFNEISPACQSPVHENDLCLSQVRAKTDEEKSNKSRKTHHNVSAKSTSVQPRENENKSNTESNALRVSQLNARSFRTVDSHQGTMSRLDQDKFVLPLQIPDKGFSGKYWCSGVQQDTNGPSALYWDRTDPNWSHSTISGSCSCFTSDFESAEDSDTIMALVALGCPLSSEKGSVCTRCTSFTNNTPVTSTSCTENVYLACTPSSDSDDFYTPLQEFAPGQVNGLPYPAVPVVQDPLSPTSFQSLTEDQNIQETVKEGYVQTIRDGVTEPGTEKVDVSKSEELRTMEILDVFASYRTGTDFTSEKCQVHSMNVVDGPVVKHGISESPGDASSHENMAAGHRHKDTCEASTSNSEGKLNKNILELINHVENEIIESLKHLGENANSEAEAMIGCNMRVNKGGKRVNVNREWRHQDEGSNLMNEEEAAMQRKVPLPGAEHWHEEGSDAPCSMSGGPKCVRPNVVHQTDNTLMACAHTCGTKRRQDERVFNNLTTSTGLCGQCEVELNKHLCCTRPALLNSGESSEEKETRVRGSDVDKCKNANISNLNSVDTKNGSFQGKANVNTAIAGNGSLSSSDGLEEDVLLSGHVTSFHPGEHELSLDTILATTTSFPSCEESKDRNLSPLQKIDGDQAPSYQTSQQEDLDTTTTPEPLHEEEGAAATSIARNVAPVLPRDNVISQSSIGNDAQAAKSLPLLGSCFIQREIPEDMADSDEREMKSQVMPPRGGILLKNVQNTARQNEMKEKEGTMREGTPPGHDHCGNVAPGDERKNRLDTPATSLRQGTGHVCAGSNYPPGVSLSSCLPGPPGHQCLSQPSIYACVVGSGRSIQGSFTSGLRSPGERPPQSGEGGGKIVGLGSKDLERDRLNWTPSRCGPFRVSGPDGTEESQTNLSATVVLSSLDDSKNTKTDSACFVGNVDSDDKWKNIYSETALLNPDALELKTTSDCDSSSILRALSEIVNSSPTHIRSTVTGKSWKQEGSHRENSGANEVRRNIAGKQESGMIVVDVRETEIARVVENTDGAKTKEERVGVALVEEKGKTEAEKEMKERNGRGRKKYDGGMGLCREGNVGSRETNTRLSSCRGSNKTTNITDLSGNQGHNILLSEGGGHIDVRGGIREFVEWNGDAVGICSLDEKNTSQALTCLEDERHETKKIIEDVNSGVTHLSSFKLGGPQKDSRQPLERDVMGETDWVNTRRVCGDRFFNEPMIGKSQTFLEMNVSADEGALCTFAASRKDGSEGKREINNEFDERREEEGEETNSVQLPARQSHQWNQSEGWSGEELRGEGSKLTDKSCGSCFNATPNSNKSSPTTQEHVMGVQVNKDRAWHSSLTEQSHLPSLHAHQTNKLPHRHCQTNDWSLSKKIRQKTAPTCFENKQEWPAAHCPLILPGAEEKSFHGEAATSGSNSFVSESDTTAQMESIQLQLIPDAPESSQRSDALGMCSDSPQGTGEDFGHSVDPRRPEETQNILNKQLIDQAETWETKRVLEEEEDETENGKEKRSCQLQNTTEEQSNSSQTTVQLLVKYFETFPVGACELKQ